MSKQKHSFSWKVKKSLWALTSLLFLAWVGFFYIGNKADNKKWKFAGVVYIITQLGTVILSLSFKNGSPVDNALFSIWFAMYFVGIIHSILTIRPYLRFCEEAENSFSDADPATARPASLNTPDSSQQTPLSHAESDLVPKMQEARYTEPDYSAVPEDYVPSDAFADAAQAAEAQMQGAAPDDAETDKAAERSSAAAQPAGAISPQSAGIVSLSRCTAGQLAALPGMTAEKAERALAYRHENGGFLSIDEFIAVADVPVQEEEKLRARIILG